MIINFLYWRQNLKIYINFSTVMSKKICFASVLSQKRGSQIGIQRQTAQISLRQMMEQYINFPKQDYKLRYSCSNNLRSGNSKQGFQEGFNPLDQWIHSQKQYNKQNILDTQPRKQIPNQLLKYAKVNDKSPKRQSHVKSDLPGQNYERRASQKNLDMKQMCRQYAQNKRKGKNMSKEGLVWRFSSKNDSQHCAEEQNQNNQAFINQTQMITSERFIEFPNINDKQVSKIREQKIQNQLITLPPKSLASQGAPSFIQQIKKKLTNQIADTAERMIKEKKKLQQQNQGVNTKQRQNQEQQRLDMARKYIGEYLSTKQEGNLYTNNNNTGAVQKAQSLLSKKSTKEQQKIQSSTNQHVGYSFASDFAGKNTQQEACNQSNQVKIQENLANLSMQKRNKFPQSKLNLSTNQISLPNIDQVKSQRDVIQKINDDFVEEAMTIKNFKALPTQQIDKNYIKQIQSVAYTQGLADQSNYVRVDYHRIVEYTQHPSPQYSKNNESKKQSPECKPKIGSIFQQVSKTAMSIEQWQDGNEVNISVAQSQIERDRIDSAKKSLNQNIKLQADVTNFSTPTNNMKIQFKKVASPDRIQNKSIQLQQSVPKITTPPNVTSTNNYINYTPLTNYIPSSNASQNFVVSPSSLYKTSFTNILQTNNQNSTTASKTNAELQSNKVNLISTSNQNTGYHHPTETQIRNSRERNNSLKNSEHDQGRKLKITICPKYNEEQNKSGLGTSKDLKFDNKFGQKTETTAPSSTYYPSNTIKTSFTSVLANNQNLTCNKLLNNNTIQNDALVSKMPIFSTTIISQTSQDKQSNKQKQQAMIKVQKTQICVQISRTKQSIKNNQSIARSSQFEFDLDF